MKRTLTGLAVGLLLLGSTARAAESEEARLTELQQQIESLTKEVKQLKQELVAKDYQQYHREELQAMMKDILDDAKAQPALPSWMENLTFSGDLRLRFDVLDEQSRSNASASSPKQRNRFRFRLRFGFTKTWWDKQLEVGFRLTSGTAVDANGANAREWNEDFGDGFSKKPIWIDLAYAKYQPKCIEGLVIAAGKVPNLISSKTEMTWEPTITPEGIFTQYKAPFFGNFIPYAEFGYWIVDENTQESVVNSNNADDDTLRDVTVYTYGMGFDWLVMDNLNWFLGGTYYQVENYNGVNTGGLDGTWNDPDMGLLELTTRFRWDMLSLPWEAWFSWTHNCREDYAGTDRDQRNTKDGYHVGIKAGENKKKGDWSASYRYMYIPAYSVVGEFTDAVFGGPNRHGHVLGGAYNIDDFLTLSTYLYLTEPISSSFVDSGGTLLDDQDLRVRLQAQLVWKF
jgi:hypothetical protein